MKPISEMTPLEIREAVATRVMGIAVVGRATCVYVEGEEMVSEGPPEGWACPAETGPVYVSNCRCAFWDNRNVELMSPREKTAGGHYATCLAPVPAYESEIGPAFDVVAKMREKGYHFEMEYGPGENSVCCATFSMYGSRGHARLLPVPLAIAAAALEAIGSAK